MHAPADCLLDAIALSLIADGEVTEHEMQLTVGIVKDLPPFAGKDLAVIEAIVGEAFERFVSEGQSARVDALLSAGLDGEGRREVVMAAALVMHADGGIGNEEEGMLAELAKTLSVPDEERTKILTLVRR